MANPPRGSGRNGGSRSFDARQQQPVGEALTLDTAKGRRIPSVTPRKSSSPAKNTSSSTKGLRMMSVKICEKVQQSVKTTCTAVADELIQLIKREREQQGNGKTCDEKNVRRRTYDALNVLEAVQVIGKDSKDITWKGLPSEANTKAQRLKTESDSRKKRIKEKEEALREHLIQQVSYRNLVAFNKLRSSNPNHKKETNRIDVPLIVFSANTEASVHCDASRDMSHVMMDANAPFTIHDENSILRQMGLAQTTLVKLKELVPADMLDYCQKQSLLGGLLSRKRARDSQASAQAVSTKPKTRSNAHRRAKRFKYSY